jgi:hypothetical protein
MKIVQNTIAFTYYTSKILYINYKQNKTDPHHMLCVTQKIQLSPVTRIHPSIHHSIISDRGTSHHCETSPHRSTSYDCRMPIPHYCWSLLPTLFPSCWRRCCCCCLCGTGRCRRIRSCYWWRTWQWQSNCLGRRYRSRSGGCLMCLNPSCWVLPCPTTCWTRWKASSQHPFEALDSELSIEPQLLLHRVLHYYCYYYCFLMRDRDIAVVYLLTCWWTPSTSPAWLMQTRGWSDQTTLLTRCIHWQKTTSERLWMMDEDGFHSRRNCWRTSSLVGGRATYHLP